MSRLTPRKEDYIKTIYKLSEINRAVCVKDVAQFMGGEGSNRCRDSFHVK